MEKYLNIFYYCLYRAHYRSYLFFSKINPFNLLHKLPFQKRKYAELGIDINKEMDKVFGDRRFGLSASTAAGYFMVVLLIFIFDIVAIIIGLLSPGINFAMKHFIPMVMLAYAVYYFFVSKNDKYIHYFDEFEKLSHAKIRKYSWLSFAFIVCVMGLFMLGLKLAIPPTTP